ncbi:MAG: hypothetical protein ACRD2X_01380 [Vicinamibacteraceae bacterium]
MVDVDLSERIAQTMRPRPRNKNCFLNAFRGLSAATRVTEQTVYYVEGIANGVIGHGWLETEDGRVIEVTPVWRAKPAATYEAVRRYTAAQVVTALENRKGATLPLVNLDEVVLTRWAPQLGAGSAN